MGNRYLVLFGLLGAALVAYGVWWMNEADRVPDRLKDQIAHALPKGVEARFSVGDITGFPFRFVAPLHDVEVSVNGTARFRSGLVNVIMQPFNSGHIVLRLDDPVAYGLPDGGGTVTAERALASMTGLNGGPRRIDLDSMNLIVAPQDGSQTSASRFGLHIRWDGVAQHPSEFALSARGLNGAGLPDGTGETGLSLSYQDAVLNMDGAALSEADAAAFLARF